MAVGEQGGRGPRLKTEGQRLWLARSGAQRLLGVQQEDGLHAERSVMSQGGLRVHRAERGTSEEQRPP